MAVVADIHLIGTAAARPAAGSTNNGYYYTATDTNGGTTYRSNATTWVQIAGPVTNTGMSNPMTTTGDIIYSSDGSGTPARLAVGAAGTYLKSSSGLPAYVAPAVGVFLRSSGQVISTGTTTAINMTEESDVDGWHDNGVNPNRATCPSAAKAGPRIIVASVALAANATGRREAYLRVTKAAGGTNFIAADWRNGDASLEAQFCLCGYYNFVANDYVELLVWQNSGGNISIGDGTANNYYASMAISSLQTA